MRAIDADRYHTIRYQLFSGNTSFFANNYRLREDGEIQTSQELDHEQYQKLELVVMAYNPDNLARNSTVPVVIKIIDLNDNSPIFSHNNYSIRVPEFAMKGDAVGNVMATDADNGNFGAIIYSITASLPIGNIFAINETTGNIYVASATLPDRQQNPNYALQMHAQDGGMPPREATTIAFITVTDVNEEPVFTQQNYTVEQAEDITIGTVILQVHATEIGDIGNNSRITYLIFPPEGYVQDPVYTCINSSDITNTTTYVCHSLFPFRINPFSGEISIQSPLDYEKNTNWVFSVVAKDGGVVSLNDTTTVIVTVNDVNDNAPVFDDDPFHVFVNYTLSVGSVATNAVKASDADSIVINIIDCHYHLVVSLRLTTPPSLATTENTQLVFFS